MAHARYGLIVALGLLFGGPAHALAPVDVLILRTADGDPDLVRAVSEELVAQGRTVEEMPWELDEPPTEHDLLVQLEVAERGAVAAIWLDGSESDTTVWLLRPLRPEIRASVPGPPDPVLLGEVAASLVEDAVTVREHGVQAPPDDDAGPSPIRRIRYRVSEAPPADETPATDRSYFDWALSGGFETGADGTERARTRLRASFGLRTDGWVRIGLGTSTSVVVVREVVETAGNRVEHIGLAPVFALGPEVVLEQIEGLVHVRLAYFLRGAISFQPTVLTEPQAPDGGLQTGGRVSAGHLLTPSLGVSAEAELGVQWMARGRTGGVVHFGIGLWLR